MDELILSSWVLALNTGGWIAVKSELSGKKCNLVTEAAIESESETHANMVTLYYW